MEFFLLCFLWLCIWLLVWLTRKIWKWSALIASSSPGKASAKPTKAQLEAEKQATDEQARRRRARAKAEALYLAHPEIVEQLSREQFDRYMKEHLHDDLSADLVEANCQELSTIIDAHVQIAENAVQQKLREQEELIARQRRGVKKKRAAKQQQRDRKEDQQQRKQDEVTKAQEMVLQFYEDHADLLEPALPQSLLEAHLYARVPDTLNPSEAWVAARDLMVEIQNVVLDAQERRKESLVAKRQRDAQRQQIEKQIQQCHREIDELLASERAPSGIGLEVIEIQQHIQELEQQLELLNSEPE